MKTQRILIAILFASVLFATSCKNNDNAVADQAPVAETATPVAIDTTATATPAVNAPEPTTNNEKKGGEKKENEAEDANED